MSVIVKNIQGTSNRKLPSLFENWLHYWETKKGIKAIDCLNSECNNAAEVGGHIGLISRDDVEYILPICFECNNDRDKKFCTNGSYLAEVK